MGNRGSLQPYELLPTRTVTVIRCLDPDGPGKPDNESGYNFFLILNFLDPRDKPIVYREIEELCDTILSLTMLEKSLQEMQTAEELFNSDLFDIDYYPAEYGMSQAFRVLLPKYENLSRAYSELVRVMDALSDKLLEVYRIIEPWQKGAYDGKAEMRSLREKVIEDLRVYMSKTRREDEK